MSSQQQCADLQTLQSPLRPRSGRDAPLPPYGSQQSDSITTGAAHYSGDSSNKVNHPNALCVTSRPGSNLSDKCQLAFQEHSDGTSNCAWSGNFLASVYADNMPPGNRPTQCSKESDPNAVCVPDGTIPLLCMGQKVNQDYSIAPSWIAVPKSEAIYDLTNDRGCHAGNLQPHKDPHDYMKTLNKFKPQ